MYWGKLRRRHQLMHETLWRLTMLDPAGDAWLLPGLLAFTGLFGLAALAVALLTVGYQAVKAALADPVQSLRYE